MSRNVLVVLSEHDGAASLLQNAANALYRPGDRFQLLWVTNHAELLKEAAAMGEHEPAGPGQNADASRAVEETVAARHLAGEVAAKYGQGLDALKIPYQVHVLPASPLHTGAAIVQSAGAESAAVVVLPKAASAFITTYINTRLQQPVLLAGIPLERLHDGGLWNCCVIFLYAQGCCSMA